MQFASIGSGSEGNGTLIRNGSNGAVLLDCGFSCRQALIRMSALDLVAADLAALIVTHEHGDHIKGIARLANKHRIPVFTTWGTWAAKLNGVLDDALFHVISPHQPFDVADMMVEPVPVPHDAREPCQFVFEGNGKRLGVVTDAGMITPHMRSAYECCDSLILECNHDLTMLAEGPYPASLKRRVASTLGHLNNQQAAELLSQIHVGRLQQLVVAHLSKTNNHPELALNELQPMLKGHGVSEQVIVAEQDSGFDWLSLQ